MCLKQQLLYLEAKYNLQGFFKTSSSESFSIRTGFKSIHVGKTLLRRVNCALGVFHPGLACYSLHEVMLNTALDLFGSKMYTYFGIQLKNPRQKNKKSEVQDKCTLYVVKIFSHIGHSTASFLSNNYILCSHYLSSEPVFKTYIDCTVTKPLKTLSYSVLLEMSSILLPSIKADWQ